MASITQMRARDDGRNSVLSVPLMRIIMFLLLLTTPFLGHPWGLMSVLALCGWAVLDSLRREQMLKVRLRNTVEAMDFAERNGLTVRELRARIEYQWRDRRRSALSEPDPSTPDPWQ